MLARIATSAVSIALLAPLTLTSGCSRVEDSARSSSSSPPSAPTAPAPTPATPPPSSAAIAPVDACAAAEKALDDFIATLDATCSKDDDCSGYYLHEDVCKGSTMLHVPGCPPETKPLLFVYQANVRKSCPSKPECAPVDYKPTCKAGRCVDAALGRPKERG